MAGGRQRGGGSPRIDWAAALAFWLSLDPPRALRKVAERFDVSDTAVYTHARKHGWRQKAAEVDARALAKAEAGAARTREEHVARVLRTVRLGLDQVEERLEEGEQLPIERYGEWVKLAELLSGEATDRLSFEEMQGFLRISIGLAVSITEELSAELFNGKAKAYVKAFRQRYLEAVNAELGAGE